MSEAKFTPGPWQIWEGPAFVGGGADLCIGAGDTWLANMDHRDRRCEEVFENNHDDDGCPICTIDAPKITAEQRANARLIAASPDLLAACQAAWNCIGELPPTQARIETAQVLRAAIAKATGEGK